ncbi:hypothetical protein HG535_0A05220 [Zygotorulaspora mrakii]|uniref:U3 small nucleolar ribonucleoprotein protein MPP10 n=1 Tax=Zygotorulaspora mrakii TaxID=42260 RepID=A0A7H9AWD9_ZYGMR|nr:uncharacterized protein HG535_0A05220 [Zygotorulaspora mrakii]QLG70581.1 hypothetical protein HG535_0A05220 [Zygotorulaspora mrakii]
MSNFFKTLQASPADVISLDSFEALQSVKSHVDEVINLYKKSEPTKKTDFEEITITGLDARQVWWQTKMVLDDVEADLLEKIDDLRNVIDSTSSDEDEELKEVLEGREGYESTNSRSEDAYESDRSSEILESSGEEQKEELQEENEVTSEEAVADKLQFEQQEPYEDEGKHTFRLSQDLKEGAAMESGQEAVGEKEPEAKTDKYGLNDDFFNFNEFNRQTLEAEENSGSTDGTDESIDYFEDVPSDEDEEAIYYEDFFDKPASKNVSTKSQRGSEEMQEDLTNADYQSALKFAKLDLFAEDEDVSDEEDNSKEYEEKHSSHQKQQSRIQMQIEELEKEAVAEKKWALKGEVKAQDRPEDALLTEEIEFDRTAKPVPVITAEVTESLEDMIRRRIKDENFDDLQRRVLVDLTARSRKPQFELSDQKSSKSLADIYEDDYKHVSQDATITEELKKSHDEISELFTNLNYKLDALSSAHFIPKPPQKSLEVRVETDAITMEDAQPLSMSSASALAPQEIYSVGKSDNSNEIRLKDGTTMAKDEMSRENKSRLRRAIKRKRSKAIKDHQSKPNKQSKKESAIETLSRAKNVTVIDKKGGKSDVRGNIKSSSTSLNNHGHQIKL